MRTHTRLRLRWEETKHDKGLGRAVKTCFVSSHLKLKRVCVLMSFMGCSSLQQLTVKNAFPVETDRLAHIELYAVLLVIVFLVMLPVMSQHVQRVLCLSVVCEAHGACYSNCQSLFFRFRVAFGY